MQVKPSETPPVIRLVIRTKEGFYYTGHGQGPTTDLKGNYYPPVGKAGEPTFDTKNILFAIKYGDTDSIERLFKNHKIWCIEHNRDDLMALFDECDVLETYT